MALVAGITSTSLKGVTISENIHLEVGDIWHTDLYTLSDTDTVDGSRRLFLAYGVKVSSCDDRKGCLV